MNEVNGVHAYTPYVIYTRSPTYFSTNDRHIPTICTKILCLANGTPETKSWGKKIGSEMGGSENRLTSTF